METTSLSVYQTDLEKWMNESFDGNIIRRGTTSWSDDKCRVFEFVMSTIVIGFICVMGLVLNTLSFAVLSRDKNNEVATFLLKSVSVADNAVLLVSFIILSCFFGPSQIPSANAVLSSATPFMMVIIHPLGYIAQSCSIWMTVLLAINRFITVYYPFLSEQYLTIKLAKIQVAVVVLFSILLNVPRFFVYSFTYEEDSKKNVTSKRIWYKPTNLNENRPFHLYYINIFYSSVVLILPLVILVIFNFAIVHAIKKSATRMRRSSMNTKGTTQEKNLTVVMIVIIIELVLCHSLDRVLLVFKYILPASSIRCPNAINYASHTSNLLILINSSTDFFIYVIFKKRFRTLLRKMCRCFVCCKEKKKLPTSHRPSSCSQISDISKIGCLKQMELKSGHYKPLSSSSSFRTETSPSDSNFHSLGAKGTPLFIRKFPSLNGPG